MTTEIIFHYRPLPIHLPFHRSTAKEKVLFGAFGSGKTYALCSEAIALALEQPGSRILITRRTVPELRDTTETVFFDILPADLFKAGTPSRSGGHYERFTFPNGSVVLFRSIDDWNKHRSMNLAAIFWDEANEFDEETVLGMSSRVRQVEPTREGLELGAGKITRRYMCFATNPGGHDFMYRLFVDPKTKRPGSEFWKSTSFDNPFLPKDYLEALLTYPVPWIRRYVLCSFDDFAGAIYEDWGWDTHVIKPPREGWPKGSTYWMGFDPGTQLPSAGLWVVVDRPNRRLVGIAEYELANLAADVHAKNWRIIEARHRMKVAWRVADPTAVAMRDRGTNQTLSSQYRRLGFNFQPGAKDHRDRIPALGLLIHRKQFVLTDACVKTYDAIKNYRWSDLSPTQRAKGLDAPQTPVKKNDHLVDVAQYLSGRWVKPLELKPKARDLTTLEEFSDDAHKLIRKQIARNRMRSRETPVGSVR